MANITNITNNAVQKYFKALEYYGYKSYDDVNKLMLLIAIQELVDYDFRYLIEENDYTVINNALYCLYGSTCLIPWPNYCSGAVNMDYTGISDGLIYNYYGSSCCTSLEPRVKDLEHKSITGQLDIIKDVDLNE